MKIRVVRQRLGAIDGVALGLYHEGQVYDVPAVLATYLVAEGVAVIEMRRDETLPKGDGDCQSRGRRRDDR